MPTTSLPPLSPVAAEYLRHHDELEAARDLFLSERSKLLDALGERMREATEKPLTVLNVKRDDKAGEIDLDISGAYVAKRAGEDDKRRSGFSAHIGSFLGSVGAQTTLWFQLKLTTVRRQKLKIAELEKQLGPDVRTISEGMWLYLRIAAQPADALDLAALENEATRLPELFATADQWIATRWRD